MRIEYKDWNNHLCRFTCRQERWVIVKTQPLTKPVDRYGHCGGLFFKRYGISGIVATKTSSPTVSMPPPPPPDAFVPPPATQAAPGWTPPVRAPVLTLEQKLAAARADAALYASRLHDELKKPDFNRRKIRTKLPLVRELLLTFERMSSPDYVPTPEPTSVLDESNAHASGAPGSVFRIVLAGNVQCPWICWLCS